MTGSIPSNGETFSDVSIKNLDESRDSLEAFDLEQEKKNEMRTRANTEINKEVDKSLSFSSVVRVVAYVVVIIAEIYIEFRTVPYMRNEGSSSPYGVSDSPQMNNIYHAPIPTNIDKALISTFFSGVMALLGQGCGELTGKSMGYQAGAAQCGQSHINTFKNMGVVIGTLPEKMSSFAAIGTPFLYFLGKQVLWLNPTTIFSSAYFGKGTLVVR